MSNYKVGCSPGTSTIFAGTVRKDGTWAANRKDVTDTAPTAVAQHLLQLNQKIQFKYKGESYELKVEKIKTHE